MELAKAKVVPIPTIITTRASVWREFAEKLRANIGQALFVETDQCGRVANNAAANIRRLMHEDERLRTKVDGEKTGVFFWLEKRSAN